MTESKKKLGRVVLKEEFALLLGDAIAAMILNQFLYWTDVLQKAYETASEEWEKGLTKDKPTNRDGWIWKSAKELKEKELFNIASEKSIERRLSDLVDRKLLLRRNNPNKKEDRTYQYKVNFVELQRQLQEIGFGLDGYVSEPAPLSIRQNDGGSEPTPLSIRQNDECIRQNDGTIPKTTTKTTESDREIGSQAYALTAPAEEQEFLILQTLTERFFPRESVKGNLNRLVEPKHIWRYWKTHHPELTIYHMYAVLEMVDSSPSSTKYDATSIICRQMEIAQTLLIPVKEAAMNEIYLLKQDLTH